MQDKYRTRSPGVNQLMNWLEANKPGLIERYLDPGEHPMHFINEIAVVVGFRPVDMELDKTVGGYLNQLRPYLEAYDDKD